MGTTCYSISEYVQDRRHAGELAGATAVGRSSLGGQPPFTALFVQVVDNRLMAARYQTSGCGFLMACCGAAIDLCLGELVEDCAALTPDTVATQLHGLPVNRRYCADLAVVALLDALASSIDSQQAEANP
jgi:nitrogen fixation protein NifQ